MTAAPSASHAEGPRHVAIIMDGNGRWAARRGLPRALGHREGVQALKRTIEGAPHLGVRCLTVFGFSTENWSRPEDEVSDLMGLVLRVAREGKPHAGHPFAKSRAADELIDEPLSMFEHRR